MKRIYYILISFILTVPIGLYLTNAPAWGEWENDYYKEHLGFIPKNIDIASQSAPLPDYSLSSLGEISSYYLSALVGVILIFGIFFLLKRFVKHE
ncbi:PDGLE domain-containing protein [Sulfurimonas sp.]